MVKYLAFVDVESDRELEAVKAAVGNEELVVEGYVHKRVILWSEGEKEAAHFARNWHKFDPVFEKAITCSGINLGFLQENAFFYLFKDIVLLLDQILGAIEREKPNKIIANRNCLVGSGVAAVAKSKGLDNVVLVDSPRENRFSRFPNFTTRKLGEVWRKKHLLLAPFRKHGKGRTVFVRGRDRLDSFKKELQNCQELNVVSLDEFLLQRMLNPLNALRYFRARVSRRRKFRDAVAKFRRGREFREKFVYRGINFAEMLLPLLEQSVKRDWPEFAFLIEELSALFESEKPKAVVLWEDIVPFERICALLAKRQGTASLVIQHGFIMPILKGDWIQGFAPLTADKIAVWGPGFKQFLAEHGVEEGRIGVTGWPKLDRISKGNFKAAEARKRLGLRGKERLVVLAPQLTFSMDNLREIADAVEGLQGARLVVKVHPVATPAVYSNVVGKRATVLQHELDLYDLLSAADVVITEKSTVGLEAMEMGKPVVVFTKEKQGINLYIARNAALVAHNVRELQKGLAVALGKGKEKGELQKRAQRFVSDFAFKQDGRASERAVELLKSMMQDGSG